MSDVRRSKVRITATKAEASPLYEGAVRCQVVLEFFDRGSTVLLYEEITGWYERFVGDRTGPLIFPSKSLLEGIRRLSLGAQIETQVLGWIYQVCTDLLRYGPFFGLGQDDVFSTVFLLPA